MLLTALHPPVNNLYYSLIMLQTLQTSVVGCYEMLSLAQAKGARLLFTSTSEIYGDPSVHPQPESYWGNVNSIGERSCYDEAKRYAEALCVAFSREHSLSVGIARIFNTYGPRLASGDGRVVSNFIFQALSSKPLTIYGDGLQTRCFCYVDDQVRGLLKLLDSEVTGPINIGSIYEITMLDLAKVVISLTGVQSDLVYQSIPADDPTQRKPDITLAKTVLGWSPSTTLHDGLEKTIEWFRSAYSF
jgi:UDP-glucuronate decarboxylase